MNHKICPICNKSCEIMNDYLNIVYVCKELLPFPHYIYTRVSESDHKIYLETQIHPTSSNFLKVNYIKKTSTLQIQKDKYPRTIKYIEINFFEPDLSDYHGLVRKLNMIVNFS